MTNTKVSKVYSIQMRNREEHNYYGGLGESVSRVLWLTTVLVKMLWGPD